MKKKKSVLRLFLGFCLKLGAVVLVVTLALLYVIGLVRVSGNSMYPALSDGDLCVTYKLDPYRMGDIVAYNTEDAVQLGRIVAHTGDVIDADEQGLLLINGVRPLEAIFYPTEMKDIPLPLPCTVGEGEYFLLNDFRSDQNDSRIYGCVPETAMCGKLILTLRIRGF